VAEAAFALLGATYGAALSDVDVTLPPELDDVSPRRFDNVLAGGELLLVARMPRERVEGQVRLRGRVGEEVFERTYDLSLVASAGGGNAFVPRLFAATKITDLEHDSTSEARERVVSLSQRFNVASRYTSLLVLESPAMFKAFGLDNRRTVPLWTGELEAEKSEAGDVLEEQARFDFDDESTDSLGTLGSGGFDSPSSGRGAAGPGGAAKAKKPAFAPPPASAPQRRRSEESASDQDLSERSRDRWPLAETEAPSDSRAFEPLPPVPPSRPMIPMRKIWERHGTISTASETPVSDEELATRRARFEQNPLAREALKALYSAYLLRGELDRAEELATRWSAKDPLDADALTARADLAAERGDRKLALRILGSVVDVRPSDHQALFRLARAYRWAGEGERGCRYALAEAQRRTTHAATVAAAVRCLRDLGERELSQQVLASAPSNLRNEVDRLVAGNAPPLAELSGDFRVEGTWEASGDEDLDIVIVHPDGYRVSWLGAPTRAVISATDVVSRNREGLALRGAQVGRYAVEVVRSSEARVGGAQRGELVIRVGSERRTVPFVIEGTRARVATVQVAMRSRLVPL
jgi:tetratricopeptide (TPR) repeat protein